MKYFRIGYCPPSPGGRSKPAAIWFSEKEIPHLLEEIEKHPMESLWMKPNIGAKYQRITIDKIKM